ncbi:hypothetical protein RSOLAG22IIIB_10930 [Rhizoctonia solani]|uniref:EOS1 domain-containing protein n=1 Tax=Rhizoctonia solani TaxID=456999 RepID=A0A0K6G6F9_9AGAM|nr:hypothetical protein RSOLAG22IIIB_10930 [Rhizoctonia solani]
MSKRPASTRLGLSSSHFSFTALAPDQAASRSRRSSRASSPTKTTSKNNQRRSCPTSPSASFVSLQTFQQPAGLSPRRTRTRSSTQSQAPNHVTSLSAPICFRSRSSSHPHLTGAGVFTPVDNIYGASAWTAPVPTCNPTNPLTSFFPSGYPPLPTRTMEDSDTEQDQLMFGGRQLHHASGLGGSIGRMRLKSRSKDKLKGLDVTETETEREGPARVLPTARGPAHHRPSTTPLASRLIPLVLFLCRLLAVVPATIGTALHIRNAVQPPQGLGHTRIDFAVAACWSVLTGIQCWFLTSGLLVRWRAYYPLLSTLVRLLALQAICWPATHITLSVLDVSQRPTACWAVVGTTTCISRAIQLWATSNLGPIERGQRVIYGRKWDWGEVALKCGFPCAMVYVLMAWGSVFNQELGLNRC